ncbi:metal-dependent hydrolase, partial [bacterium]|nr:metal-dependent hydrolase [bacterium]
CLCWVAGMMPDLDSQSGKPIRELFSLAAALAPLVLMQHLHALGGNTERAMFLGLIVYALVRYGGATLVGALSVHRGMFHSVPALLIAAELTFLFYKSPAANVKFFMAGAVAIGFLSHLVLDEMYSVQWNGGRLKLAKSAGSAMKMVGKHFWPNAVTYGLLGFLTFAVLVKTGLATLPGEEKAPPVLQQATELEDAPIYR